MGFLKRYPIPIAGLILALFALGNLVQSYSAEARLALGAVGLVLYLVYLLKIVLLNAKLREPLENPVAASVFPTFTMATMLLAGYVKPYNPPLGEGIWYAGFIGHILLIVWFSFGFLRGFSIKKVFPSWFIVYVGLAVASISAPVVGRMEAGRIAFWFAFVTYLCLLPFVCWRVWKVGQIPDPAKPTAVIFAAPASLLLAGYMTAFDVKQPAMLCLLLGLSLFFYLVGLGYLLRLCWGPFMPSHSAFTFPLVISAIGVKMTGAYLGKAIEAGPPAWLPVVVNVQTVIAAVVVLWVLARYVLFLLSNKN